MNVLHLIPGAAGGVRDYAFDLARVLHDQQAVGSRFVTGTPGERAESPLPDIPVVAVAARSSRALLVRLAETDSCGPAERPTALVVHYVHYGFARRGCPWWLLRGLGRWRRRVPDQRLVIFFHELYASGPPWRSSFWLYPAQRAIARALCRLSDVAITSLPRFSDQLVAWDPRKRSAVPVWPVFSTVGEPRVVPPVQDRQRQLVVFGGEPTRTRLYRRGMATIRWTVESLGINTIVDVGPGVDVAPSSVAGVGVRRTGKLPPERIGSIMLDSLAGVIEYPESLLGKSTVFAAYCAYGLVPVVSPQPERWPSILSRGEQYLVADGTRRIGADEAGRVAAAARDWYRGHDRAQHARELAAAVQGTR